MNKLSIYALKAFRILYAKVSGTRPLSKPPCEQNADRVSQIIFEKLVGDKPCMVARFGSTELSAVVNFIGVKYPEKRGLKYIKGNSLPWWWNRNVLNQMQQWSGFFPPTEEKVSQFCELMLQDMNEVDVLGSWFSNEFYFEEELRNATKIRLIFIDPY